jgi:hypothetical protein
MRRAFFVLFLLVALVARADDTQEIHVYRRGKVLGYDKDVGETLNEALIETWSCETGKCEKTEHIETYFHLSEDGEVLTPRALCDRCRERFELEKRGAKWIFKGLKKEQADGSKKPAVAPVASPSRAAIDQDALAELQKKASEVAGEVVRIDPREVNSATKRRRLIEDRGLQVAFDEWKADGQAALAVAQAIEARTDFSASDRYYVLRSFAWQRYHERDAKAAAIFYERAVALAPDLASAHYGLALVRKDQKDQEGEVVELARAIRAKARLKYAKLLLDVLKAAKPAGKLDAATIEKLRAGADDVKTCLEQNPPDQSGAKSAADEKIGKVLDERFPLDKKAAGPPVLEPDDEK